MAHYLIEVFSFIEFKFDPIKEQFFTHNFEPNFPLKVEQNWF